MKKDMSKLNPIEEFEFIENNFRSYLKSTFKFNEAMFEKELNGAELYKGPYINATLPFKTGKTIIELIEQKLASKEFRKLNEVNLEQKLYIHQQKSFEKITNVRKIERT